MTDGNEPTKEDFEWVEIQKKCAHQWFHESDLPSAFLTVNEFLSTNPRKDLMREAFVFRAMIHQDAGRLKEALEDLRAALGTEPEDGYVRSGLQDSLAFVSFQLGDLEGARKWLQDALESAASDPRTAGGGLILRFLELWGRKSPSVEEHALLEKIIYQSWHLLRIEGAPDLNDLEKTANQILQAQGRPFSNERTPAPKAYVPPPGNH